MKKLTFIILVFFMGCKPLLEIPSDINVYVFDYSKYLEKDFYFFENCFNGEYKLVANIFIEYFPEGKKGYNAKMQDPSEGTWVFEAINTKEILELVYKTATRYGANAIMNFSYTPVTREVFDPGKGIVKVIGRNITGNAIIIQK